MAKQDKLTKAARGQECTIVRMVAALAMILLTGAEMLIFPMMRYSGVTLAEYLGLSR